VGMVLCENCAEPIHADTDRDVCMDSNGVEFCGDQCHRAFHAVTRTACQETGR
jgi:hypothetical protein